MVTQAGQIPKRKKKRTNFLCTGKFAGVMGQLIPSPAYSLIPQMFTDSLLIFFDFYFCLRESSISFLLNFVFVYPKK
jgi:hypothetical protein